MKKDIDIGYKVKEKNRDSDWWPIICGYATIIWLMLMTIVIIFLFSCNKKQDPPKKQKTNYSLEFMVDEELPTSYKVQVNNGSGFQTIKTIPYDKNKQGDYTIDLMLDPDDQVRVEAISSNEEVYSYIVVAK